MDGRGGCCIARYAAAGIYDMSKMDRIMLRFRPIAPKPAAAGSVSPGFAPENNNEASGKSGRGKRRYSRDHGSGGSAKRYGNRKRKASSEESDNPVQKTSSGGAVSGGEAVVTLPLLPETPDRKDCPASGSPSDQKGRSGTIWLNFRCNDKDNPLEHVPDRRVAVPPQAQLQPGAIVTVECVTEAWVDSSGLGCTDEERLVNLEWDTCPGFVTDRAGRVVWTNRAYRMMVGSEMMTWLVMKERAAPITFPAFTCRVRLQYAWRKEKVAMLTVPCDVWRMDDGGFAWRLDVKAALCLGR
ncbi:uncharacterized protein LOC127793841 [Diospyros lotus]|uniref:uncharacterized protein LOC127793841 n=1 Tax=Diospyros lotus TaxID=55363 RepID=UPI002253746C|nr:uncharacterized protein LOC127793841 [Diospyros lotus]